MIRNIFIATIIAMGMTACGDYTGDTEYNNSDQSGQNNSIDNRIDYGTGTVVVCNDSNCSAVGTSSADQLLEDGNYTDIVEVGDEPRPDKSDASPATCAAAGLNYCSIIKDCTTPLDGGTTACN